MEKSKKYFYYHGESDSIWSSNLDFEHEGDPDLCTQEITEERANELAKELKIEKIPHFNK